MRLILAAGALAALTGCQYQAYADAAAALGLKSVQDAKDLEARVAIQVACVSGLGAVGRAWTPEQTFHMLALCWPPGYAAQVVAAAGTNQQVTVDTLRAVAGVLTATQPPVALRR